MPGLALKRCLNHESREAVCRCPSCRNFFCRECVVLFEARLLCAACLTEKSGESVANHSTRFGAGAIALAALGLITTWLIFYVAGWAILEMREHAPVSPESAAPVQRFA